MPASAEVPYRTSSRTIRTLALEKTRTETNLRDWLGERAQAGRLPPNGFPRSGRFS